MRMEELTVSSQVRKDVRPDAGKDESGMGAGVARDSTDTGDSGHADSYPGNGRRGALRGSYSVFSAGADAISKYKGTGFSDCRGWPASAARGRGGIPHPEGRAWPGTSGKAQRLKWQEHV